MNELPEIMAQCPVFDSLVDDQREAVASQALRRSFKKGRLIALYGEAWPYLLLVGKGQLSAVKESREGRRLVVLTLGRGDIFWGVGFFHEELVMPVTLEASSDCQVYLWNQENLLPILLKNGPALWDLCRLMITRMWEVSEIVEGLAFQPVAVRLARFIVDHYGDVAQTPMARTLTLDEMAARVGSTREQVCRILYRFSDEGMIEITRTEFTITDPEGLVDLLDSGAGKN
nr:Crp/Fnr family transcriptional regulator [Anaerolineae bacterium]